MARTLLALLLAGAGGCIIVDEPGSASPRRRTRDRWDEEWDRAVRQPLPKGNVRVTIDSFEFETIDRTVFEAALRYKDSNATIQMGSLTGVNGLLLFAAKDGFTGAFRAETSRARRIRTTQQFLPVMVGSRGRFEVLASIPLVRTIIIPIYGGGAAVVRTYEERVTGSGFEVAVHGEDERGVDLELTPYFNREADGDALIVTELRSRFTAVPGRPYVLMADRRRETAFAQTFFAAHAGERRLQVIKVLTVDVGR